MLLTLGWFFCAGVIAGAENQADGWNDWRRVGQFVVAVAGCVALWIACLTRGAKAVAALIASGVLFVGWLVLILV